jgi:hypothetical protein
MELPPQIQGHIVLYLGIGALAIVALVFSLSIRDEKKNQAANHDQH